MCSPVIDRYLVALLFHMLSNTAGQHYCIPFMYNPKNCILDLKKLHRLGGVTYIMGTGTAQSVWQQLSHQMDNVQSVAPQSPVGL
jgi:hypothetical protein